MAVVRGGDFKIIISGDGACFDNTSQISEEGSTSGVKFFFLQADITNAEGNSGTALPVFLF